MKKIIFSTLITLAMAGAAFAAPNTAPGSGPQTIESDHCITKEAAAAAVISNIPDAVGLVKNNTIVFSAPKSHPDKNLVITFDDKGCAVTSEVVDAHAS